MNISGVSGNTYSSNTGMSNPQIKAIDKQIAEVQKSMQGIKANKQLDAKSKAGKIKEYEDKITQLQQQKSQIQAEERKSRRTQDGQRAENVYKSEESSDATIGESTQKALLQMDGAMETKRKMGVIREELTGKLRIAESDSYLREKDPVAAAEIRSRISDIDNIVIGKAKKAANTLKEASETREVSGTHIAGEDKDQSEAHEINASETDPEDQKQKGTGRFESGQFLYEEA